MYKRFVTLAYKREPALPDVPVAIDPPISAVARSERPAPPLAADSARDRRCRFAATLAAVLLHAAVIAALLVKPPHPMPEPPPPIPVALVFESPPPPPEPVAKPTLKPPPLRSNHSGDLDLPPGPAEEAGSPGTEPDAAQPPALSAKEARPAETTEAPPTPEPPPAPSPAASPMPPAEIPSPPLPAASPAMPTSQSASAVALLAPRPPAAERQAETPVPPLPQPKPAIEVKPPPGRPSPPAPTIGRPAPAAARPGAVAKVAPARGRPDQSGGDPYFNAVRDRIAQKFVYPAAARPLGLAGEAKYEFLVDHEGHLLQIRLLRSSGAEILDRAGALAIRNAAPLPPVPGMKPGEVVVMTMDVAIEP